MNIVTLISDLGIKDYYLAAVKAAALKAIPDVNWFDITHQIPPFNVGKAAFVLKNVWRDFPEGTIHIIGLETDWRQDTPYVIVLKEGQYFIGTDNGFFSLLFEGEPADKVYSLNMKGDEELSFPTKSIFIPIAAHICSQKPISDIADEQDRYKQRTWITPVVEHDNIRGTAIYIDSYGNVITNITKTLFEEVIGQKAFNIVLRRGDSDFDTISRTYSEVPMGEKVALFTGAGFLEIAINRGVEGSGGGAADLLGIKENDIVRVEVTN